MKTVGELCVVSFSSIVGLIIIVVKPAGLNSRSQQGKLSYAIIKAFNSTRESTTRRKIQRTQSSAMTQHLTDGRKADR
jgi:hypothetical protein